MLVLLLGLLNLPCTLKLHIFFKNPPACVGGEWRELGARTKGALKAWREETVQLKPGISG